MFNAPFALSLALLLSFPLLFLFAPHILPPKPARISLPDELDDIALFRRATLASLDGGGVPKIAYLFLTNTDLHFAPLWDLFFRGNEALYNIYVHADPSSGVTPPGGVFSGCRFISAKKTQRASPTLISAARRLLATALLDDPSNSYFALVSQYCIPLHSFTYMYATLFPKPSSTLFPSFIEISSDQPVLWDRYIARGKNVMLPEVPFNRFRAGSQFFVLARQHAVVVVRDRRLWRKFRLPCLNLDSCYPEEHYFPTLLSMEDPDGCTHYTLTRVNWTGSVGGHPHMYGPEELSASLIYELRLSNSSYSFMFARKFSPDCLQPLLDIAGKVPVLERISK
ncbi:Core-2/I-branching beta-1,6-N-acetylglucosaminyltransferase family protein [Striga asiatica]|uniref:Core-2/I-branching beta-1,6-N-acetylglucosaminyltransferase family protein n=1 Tax=Striga asiatica TaxID=4170 RepID=A0A5A7P7X4_STRAF|nr:Core-2/I-branching beta-1,6-N-acetylglucosaminyltransferase family protein [Striga asiatica]